MLYCIKIFKFNRFGDNNTDIIWSESEDITNLYLTRFIKANELLIGNIAYEEVSGDEAILKITSTYPENKIHIYNNKNKTRSVILTYKQYRSAIYGGSVLSDNVSIFDELLHNSITLLMLLLRFSDFSDEVNNIYKIANGRFNDAEIDKVEYILNFNDTIKGYEI